MVGASFVASSASTTCFTFANSAVTRLQVRRYPISTHSRRLPLCSYSPNSSPGNFSTRPRSIHPKKSLSQNFLRDKNIINRIVESFQTTIDEAHSNTAVVEVGPGLGALTAPLLAHHPNMHAIEIDQRAVQHLRHRYPELSVHHGDVLEVDWQKFSAEVGAPLAIVGNLPYNIVSQILFSLLETPQSNISTALVMMQEEVARRVTGSPCTKAYGILSVVSQLYAKPQLLFKVPNTAFFPVPKVTSAMVLLEMTPHPQFDKNDLIMNRALRIVVRTAFNQRRKKLRNALKTLSNGAPLPNGWDVKRAEELSPVEYLDLTKFLYPKGIEDADSREMKGPHSVWR